MSKSYVSNLVVFVISLVLTMACEKEQPTKVECLNDIDGNNYETIKIGEQTWMKENLRVTHYPNGKDIKLITSDTDWIDLKDNDDDKAFCFYRNDFIEIKETHGALYNYAAAKEACPEGWRLPLNNDWVKLKKYVREKGYVGNEGAALKASNNWNDNGNGINAFGFSAMPGGNRDIGGNGKCRLIGFFGDFWTGSSENDNEAFFYRFTYDDYKIILGSREKSSGCSVRCIKDN